MGILDIVFISIALSIDACAITIANCTTYSKTLNKKKEWAMPVLFALFQGVMPLLGWLLGSTFAEHISSFSGYLVALVFFALGSKIVFDNVKKCKKPENSNVSCVKSVFSYKILVLQAVATSIDALIVGVTMSMNLAFSCFYAMLIIASITFVLVTLSMLFGKFLGSKFSKEAEWIGAVILFAIAVKSLIECFI